MSDDVRYTELEDAASAVVRALVDDGLALRKVALQELRWLTVNDLSTLTGFSARTIEKWRKMGWVRMFLPADSTEYRTTVHMWHEDEVALIEAGILSKQGQKPTIGERKKRLSQSRRSRVL